jgi:hypothetical protein
VTPSPKVFGSVKDGLAVRFQWFQSHAEALEAAGVTD